MEGEAKNYNKEKEILMQKVQGFSNSSIRHVVL